MCELHLEYRSAQLFLSNTVLGSLNYIHQGEFTAFKVFSCKLRIKAKLSEKLR